MKHLVILGGGFAGVWAAMAAASQRAKHSADDIEITLISNNEKLCIKPRLYEEPHHSMLVPLIPLMDAIKVNLLIDNVEEIVDNSSIVCRKSTIYYDKLIFSLGSKIKQPEIKNNKSCLFNIDTYEASLAFNNHIQALALRNNDALKIHVIGSGFTGIELITKLHQRYKDKVALTLIEHSDSVAKNLGESLQTDITGALKQAKVNTLVSHTIESLEQNLIKFTNGQSYYTDAIVLSSGVIANPLTHQISDDLDSNGRVKVKQTLQSPTNENIFVAGDCARAKVDEIHYSLMSCQHAMPMGTYAGLNAINALLNIPLSPYKQDFYATCLDLGECGAVFTQGWDRNIDKRGSDGAAMKAQINNQWIYPPSPAIGQKEIFNLIQSTFNN